MGEPIDLQACRLRVVRLDAAGAPATGALVVDVQVAVQVEPVYATSPTLLERDVHGNVQVNRPGTSRLVNGNLSLTIVGAHPEVGEVLVGAEAVTVATGVGVLSPVVEAAPPEHGASVEVFTRRLGPDGQPDPTGPHGWWVYPKVSGLRLLPYVHQSGALLWSFAGVAEANPGWGAGPDGLWTEDLTGRLFGMVPAAAMPDLT